MKNTTMFVFKGIFKKGKREKENVRRDTIAFDLIKVNDREVGLLDSCC